MTTDTPRTDAFVAENSLLAFVEDKHELTIIHARQLERELDESKADLIRTQIEMQLEIDRAEAEVERLRSTMRSFIDFMDENLGTTADWPMEASFDDEETCQRHCDLLNAMKRIVKPEGIN